MLEIFAKVPLTSSAGIVVAQHMPDKFTRTFAERLDKRGAVRTSEAVDGRPERAATLAAAAEVFAQDEGIVVVYSDETPGRELVDQARGALSAEDLAAATEAGRRLTIDEALELARSG